MPFKVKTVEEKDNVITERAWRKTQPNLGKDVYKLTAVKNTDQTSHYYPTTPAGFTIWNKNTITGNGMPGFLKRAASITDTPYKSDYDFDPSKTTITKKEPLLPPGRSYTPVEHPGLPQKPLGQTIGEKVRGLIEDPNTASRLFDRAPWKSALGYGALGAAGAGLTSLALSKLLGVDSNWKLLTLLGGLSAGGLAHLISNNRQRVAQEQGYSKFASVKDQAYMTNEMKHRIIQMVQNDQALSFMDKSSLISRIRNLRYGELRTLMDSLSMAGGASLGILVAKKMMNMGLIGTMALAGLGAALGSRFSSPLGLSSRQGYDMFGRRI